MSHIARSITRPLTLVALTTVLAAVPIGANIGPAAARSDPSDRFARSARTSRATDATLPTDPTATPRTVVGTGIARVRGVPDLLTLTLGVTSEARTVGEALDRNNDALDRVMKALRDGGVEKQDIQTSNFSIGSKRDDRTNEINGYQVTNLVTVRIRDLAKAGSLIDKAAEAGGDDVVMQGVSFGFDDTSDLIAQARADAVKRARSQAQQLADAAGVQLGDVITISESSRDYGPVLAAPEAAAKSPAAADVTISPGSEELAVHVSIVFSIR